MTLHPGMINGPTLITDRNSTPEGVSKFLRGDIPGVPDLQFGMVDVRDVAQAHLLALFKPGINGRRFLLVD